MRIAVEEKIVEIIKKKFQIEEKIPFNESFIESGLLTSMQMVDLLFELEDEYNVQFSLDEIEMADVESPTKIATCVNDIMGVNELSIRDMFIKICEDNKDNDCIKFDDTFLTFSKLQSNVETIAANLMKYNIKKNTKVAIIMSNKIEYIYTYFALFYIGAFPVPINTRWEKHELFNVLDDSESTYIIMEKRVGSIEYGQYVKEYIDAKDHIEKIFYIDENLYGDKGIEFKELLEENKLDKSLLEDIGPDEPAMLSYTSGTTGTPKGVIIKNNNMVKISKFPDEYWLDHDTPFSIAPLYAAQGFLSLFINFASESCFKMSSSFNPNDILKEVSKCENSIIHTQPTMWTLLLNCRIIEFTKFDALRKLVVSGSLCSPELAKRIEKKMNCELLNAYGLIEGTSIATMTRVGDSEDIRYNTVGRPIPGVEIKIVNPISREEIAKGEVGELAIRGYNMQGSYNNPQKTAEVIDEEGWLYTGDLAKYYDDENISIVGRCKDMIIRGGFNVYPSDIEEYILQIPKVQTTAVVGREHKVLGEEIVAFIVPKAGEIITKNDITSYLHKRLSNYKMPDKIYFISEMPIILAGKIDKKVLFDWALNGIPADKQILFNN